MPPVVAHWSSGNGSGLDNAARAMQEAEAGLGIDSRLCMAFDEATWAPALDADVHVCHVHVPNKIRKQLAKAAKVVWVGHGTPEYTFRTSVEEGSAGRYGASDPWMLMQYWLQHADARVTFWPRHQAIYQTMVDKGTTVDLVPMGVDHAYWCGGVSRGKWGGAPSVWTAENPHDGKWPLDLFFLWPWVANELDEATLHASYVVRDQHRWWFPLVNRNGAAFRSFLTEIKWGRDDLRNAFKSIDYFIGLVRYGDFNVLSLEAGAAGARTISYRGNPHADFWVTEGDQRDMAGELIAILKGDAAPREKTPVPDISDTARAMRDIYERVAA